MSDALQRYMIVTNICDMNVYHKKIKKMIDSNIFYNCYSWNYRQRFRRQLRSLIEYFIAVRLIGYTEKLYRKPFHFFSRCQ